MTLTTLGNADSPIYVVCNPPHAGYNDKNPGNTADLKLFIEEAKSAGFKPTDFFFIQLCPPIPEAIKKSDSKTWAFVSEHIDFCKGYTDLTDKPVITLGDLATRAVMGKKHAITKVRGTVLEGKVYPMLSPAHCMRVLENMPTFKSDFLTLKKLYDNNFDVNVLKGENNNWYCHDLQFLINNPPQVISVDTETTGLRVTEPDFKVLTVQIGYGDNNCAVVPLHTNFWPEMTAEDFHRVVGQLKQILEDPRIKKVGHNINYDHSAIEAALDIVIKGWIADTQLLAATVDENMYSKSLDDCARRFVPEEAGYNDYYNQKIDKSNMLLCDPWDMLNYGGGDGRVTLKLFWVLWEMLKQDPRQYNLFIKLKMPGILGFQKMEKEGITIDLDYLHQIKEEAGSEVEALHQRLIEAAPRAVLRKHMDGWKDKKKSPHRLSRDALVRDILFTKDGFNLKPIVFTDGTKDDPNPANRIPSVSSKQHLPFFSDLEGEAGDFIEGLIEYSKLEKLNSTYIQTFEEKYVHADGKIHPSFLLHRTNTGRSSSANPNAQNFPARGPWSKKYKKIFKAKDGYKFISADLSQIELRLVAWESMDPVMIHAYKNGQDIHKITAMAVSGHTPETWDKLSKEEQKLLRYRAKAVNFGFIYGMRAKKFQRYAKTDYGVDLTPEEADRYYNLYHRTYKGIKRWHDKRISEVHQNGFVTSLHGFRRNLPSIYSNDSMIQAGAERNAINSPIQGFGSDLGVLAIARIARQVDPEIICPVAFIHDDVVLQVKDGHEEEALNMLLWVLNNPPLEQLFGIKSPIPILAEPDIGTSLGSMYELYDLSTDAPQEYHELAKKINPQKPSFWNDKRDLM
jgi:DNA polymerase I-like protein with 3'-5' exonuclease and polymerase domains